MRTSARRQRLVTDHEDVHVWQGRWFGPLYPLLYGGWMVAGGRRRRRRLGRRAGATSRSAKVVETCAYYLNPFEWWAYSRDGHWPPAHKVAGLGWRTPVRAAAQRDAAAPAPSSSASAAQQRPVERLGRLLLRPVAGALDEHGAAEVGQALRPSPRRSRAGRR